MERLILEELLEWKRRKNRKPLILKGVRQCGKTYILKDFGEKYYNKIAYFNFEKNVRLAKIFEKDMDIERILEELSFLNGEKILPETTLIIFDEIQFCSNAITSLKYFCEDCPQYHVVSAGSLLGVALARKLSFPVGKVDFLQLYPLSFKEFLMANNENMILEYLDASDSNVELSEVIEDKLKNYYKRYLIVGGMPEVVNSWITNKDIQEVERIQESILESYKMDFAKHAPIDDIPKLTMIWKAIPEQLAKENKKFIFSNIKKGLRANQLEDALEWLIDAGLIYKVAKIQMPNFPISAYADQTYFKIYLTDVGLLRKMANMPISALLDIEDDDGSISKDLYKYFKGAMIENFVLCELVKQFGNEHYFWRSNNTAEVDFIEQIGDDIVPIEVKAGKNTRAQSLKLYSEKYNPKVAIKISLNSVKKSNNLIYLPLYLIFNIKKYLK